jgi:hypothetical protein
MVIYTNDYTKHALVRKEEWKVSKTMHSSNIWFAMLLQIIYQHEWVSYFNFWNVITFMITNSRDLVNWVQPYEGVATLIHSSNINVERHR